MLDPNRMFLDYSPWPCKVLYVTHDRYDFLFRKSRWENEIRRVLLNEYCYWIEGTPREYQMYGWEPTTRTVLIYDLRPAHVRHREHPVSHTPET